MLLLWILFANPALAQGPNGYFSFQGHARGISQLRLRLALSATQEINSTECGTPDGWGNMVPRTKYYDHDISIDANGALAGELPVKVGGTCGWISEGGEFTFQTPAGPGSAYFDVLPKKNIEVQCASAPNATVGSLCTWREKIKSSDPIMIDFLFDR